MTAYEIIRERRRKTSLFILGTIMVMSLATVMYFTTPLYRAPYPLIKNNPTQLTIQKQVMDGMSKAGAVSEAH